VSSRNWTQREKNAKALAELLFKIAPDTKEVTQGFHFGSQLYGNVDVGIFPRLSPGMTAEEPDTHHAEALRYFILVCLQEHNDIVAVLDHAMAPYIVPIQSLMTLIP
jgi:hypothetical protein